MNVNSIKSVQELSAYTEMHQNQVLEYVFFWGHTSSQRLSVGKECLSQWYPSVLRIDEIVYPSAEHYMMAEKARIFNDERVREKILESTDPASVKQSGRKIKGFNEEVWREHRFEIVYNANEAKFSQNANLKEFLMSTVDKVLVEASPHDKIWGTGMDSNHKDILNPHKWRGLNLLGFALMQVRVRMATGGE